MGEHLKKRVGALDSMMNTLVEVLTMDSWNSLVLSIVKYVPWAWIFFYVYIGVAVIVLMNLVTAIMVENALLTSKADEEEQLSVKEREKSAEINQLNQLFILMDEDGDGTLSWAEFKSAFSNPVISNKW